MTRRLRGLEEVNKNPNSWKFSHDRGDDAFCFKNETDHVFNPVVCKPKYKVGETVYVKECWGKGDWLGEDRIFYRVDNNEFENAGLRGMYDFKWKSPMFMPEKYARYFIKIKSISVDRLQNISREDAAKEGCCFDNEKPSWIQRHRFPEQNFETLIDIINGKHAWSSNPWVFIYSFELTKPQ